MAKLDVFLSYNEPDSEYKDELLAQLRTLETLEIADFWDTSRIPAGADRATEIKRAIDEAEIAVLFVSPDFLASEFIVKQELPALMKRANAREILIFPILLRPTPWSSVWPQLAQFQFLNDVRRPLATLPTGTRHTEFLVIAEQLTDVMTEQLQRAEARKEGSQLQTALQFTESENGRPLVFLSHSKFDGDFAELAKYRLSEAGFDAWIDNDRLEAGIDWRQEIDESIEKSVALIAIMSPEARESEYVTYEWSFASGAKKHVIPIMLRETPMHPRLAALQYLDFTNRRARPWVRLFEVIRKRNDN